MANEAILLVKTEEAVPFTVADGAGIEKGAILKLTNLNTAVITSAAEDSFAGIAAAEKISGDGKIRLGAYRGGQFKMYLSGSVSVGHPVSVGSPANFIKEAPVTASGSATIGIALEDGADGEQIRVEVRPGVSANVS